MVDFQLSEDYRCGYCYQQFNSMTDPKELPCHHVFCKTCLEGDYSEHSNIICRSCLTEYDMDTIDELPSAKLTTQDVASSAPLNCGCHNCDGKLAVFYCTECSLMMCDTHEQTHKSLVGNQHQTIPISVYQLHPGTYKKVLCQQHGREVLEVCDKCNHMACINCDRNEQSFQDEEEVECAKRIHMIERVRDEQIEMIKEECEKLKEQIYEYQRELTDQVESYNTALMAKKEKLEESCTEVRKWLRESHVIEKVEQRQQMTDELVNNTGVMIDYHDSLTRTPALIHTGESTITRIFYE
ncbi:transcription intermediary factor 1-beta-like [Watersipora subatra]|uniref:transcription intermediary factor 1-beta-like n=1 Tax=Watersipora subatra TaxID=2589382 RepID=UPI00355C1C4F